MSQDFTDWYRINLSGIGKNLLNHNYFVQGLISEIQIVLVYTLCITYMTLHNSTRNQDYRLNKGCHM